MSYVYDENWPPQIKQVINCTGHTNQFNFYDLKNGRLLTNIISNEP